MEPGDQKNNKRLFVFNYMLRVESCSGRWGC